MKKIDNTTLKWKKNWEQLTKYINKIGLYDC